MNAIEITNLCKSYGDFTLDHLNLTLPGGCIMGLVGENGAGKSTTIRLMMQMIQKDEGTITLLSRNIDDMDALTKILQHIAGNHIGRTVRLNDDSIATVRIINPEKLSSPILELPDNSLLDLRTQPQLQITAIL